MKWTRDTVFKLANWSKANATSYRKSVADAIAVAHNATLSTTPPSEDTERLDSALKFARAILSKACDDGGVLMMDTAKQCIEAIDAAMKSK